MPLPLHEMKLILDHKIPEPKRKISYKEPVLTIGSCFAQRLGERLQSARFQCDTNPNGIVYNPISIGDMLSRALNKVVYTNRDLVQNKDVWYSKCHHGAFSSLSQQELLEQLNHRQKRLNRQLEDTRLHVFITLGSAFVYQMDGQVVANCQKLPQSHFQKRLLTVEEIVSTFSAIINSLPQTHFVFTVSPVRYIRDGLHNSMLSKSVLQLAINQLCESFKEVEYFPSYEIVTDELRDYRFYKEDLVHPNDSAVKYVWKRFSETQFDSESLDMLKEWKKVESMLNHKVLHPESAESKAFVQSRDEALKRFESMYPGC